MDGDFNTEDTEGTEERDEQRYRRDAEGADAAHGKKRKSASLKTGTTKAKTNGDAGE